MSDLHHPSSSEQEHNYHLQADEQLTLEISDAKVEIQTTIQGGCTVKVTQNQIRKQSQTRQLKFQNIFTTTGQVRKQFTNDQKEPFQNSFFWVMAALCLILYISTRLIGLQEYPIYFFTDEAVQTVLAEDLVNNDFHDAENNLLPTFFFNGYQYNLGPSVYLQVIPYMIFGRAVEVNRGISVLATSFSTIFLFMIGWRIYQMKFPWIMILLLSITPVWFLHSRTSFETGLAFTFYSGFLYYYLSYRIGNGKHLYVAILMAALAFYTYSPLQLVIMVNGLVFFLIDIRYHFQHKEQLKRSFWIIAVLAIPFVRFQVQHPGANIEHLRLLESYWIQDIRFFEKLGYYFTQYVISFSPEYWFFPYPDELSRHRMGPHAFIPIGFFPLILGGMYLAVKRWKNTIYLIPFLVLIMAPMGGALVARGITRILIVLIPLLLFGGLCLEWLIEKINVRFHISNRVLSLVLCLSLGWLNIYLLTDALNNGPTWETDYGLSGMQYGAIQLAEKIPVFLESQPEPVSLLVSPTWANGSNTLMFFFFGNPLPFEMANIETFINNYHPLTDDVVLVMTPDEIELMENNGKFTNVRVIDSIPYPNGETGFSFVKLEYINDIEAVFQAEIDARKILQVEEMTVNAVPAEVWYSYLDMGQIQDAFDHDTFSIIRTIQANPMEILVKYARPIDIASCTAHIGGNESILDLEFYDLNETMIGQYHVEVGDMPSTRTINFQIVPEKDVAAVRFLLKNAIDGEPAHVHLWEFTCSRQAE